MNLRRKYISEARGDKTFQKCLAITLVLKNRLKTSRIHQYTLNKLCKVTGISHRTAEKYEKWLLEFGFIHFEGTNINKVMVVNAIASHTTNRNIKIELMDLSSFFSAYRSLQSFIFMRIQHNKDYLRHLLQAKNHPDCPETFRNARRKVKNLVRQGVLKSADAKYEELGLSLERIAKEIGCCVRTSQRVTSFAENRGWIEKVHRYTWFNAPNINYMEIDGFTFSTRHRLCIVQPNLYILSNAVSAALSFAGMV